MRHLAQTNWSTKRFAGGADPHDAPGMLAGAAAMADIRQVRGSWNGSLFIGLARPPGAQLDGDKITRSTQLAAFRVEREVFEAQVR